MSSKWTLCAVATLGSAALAPANDVFPPEWRGNPNTVTAGWGFWGLAGPGPRVLGAGLYEANPGFGSEPFPARCYFDSEVLVQDMLFGRQSVLEVGYRSIPGTLAFGLLNYPGYDDKYIYLQITYRPGGGAPLNFEYSTVVGEPPWQYEGTAAAVVGDVVLHPDGWRTATYGFVLDGAPPFEAFRINFTEYPAYIDQVVIDTIAVCYADCDFNGVRDFFDFLCFQDAFAQQAAYADCNEDGAIDFFDFLCFQDAFTATCPQ